jgi:hypothetical protein
MGQPEAPAPREKKEQQSGEPIIQRTTVLKEKQVEVPPPATTASADDSLSPEKTRPPNAAATTQTKSIEVQVSAAQHPPASTAAPKERAAKVDLDAKAEADQVHDHYVHIARSGNMSLSPTGKLNTVSVEMFCLASMLKELGPEAHCRGLRFLAETCGLDYGDVCKTSLEAGLPVAAPDGASGARDVEGTQPTAGQERPEPDLSKEGRTVENSAPDIAAQSMGLGATGVPPQPTVGETKAPIQRQPTSIASADETSIQALTDDSKLDEKVHDNSALPEDATPATRMAEWTGAPGEMTGSGEAGAANREGISGNGDVQTAAFDASWDILERVIPSLSIADVPKPEDTQQKVEPHEALPDGQEDGKETGFEAAALEPQLPVPEMAHPDPTADLQEGNASEADKVRAPMPESGDSTLPLPSPDAVATPTKVVPRFVFEPMDAEEKKLFTRDFPAALDNRKIPDTATTEQKRAFLAFKLLPFIECLPRIFAEGDYELRHVANRLASLAKLPKYSHGVEKVMLKMIGTVFGDEAMLQAAEKVGMEPLRSTQKTENVAQKRTEPRATATGSSGKNTPKN